MLISILETSRHFEDYVVAYARLLASCRWNCDLDKLSTILELKTLRRQLYTELPRIFIPENPAV